MVIKAVSVDLEGTVVNLEPLHHEGGYYPAAQAAGLNLSYREFFSGVPNLVGGTDETICREIGQLITNQSPALERFIDAGGSIESFISANKKALYLKSLSIESMRPRPGFRKTLNWLKKKGYPVTIGTGTSIETAGIIVERSGLGGYFPRDLIVFAEDVEHVKPAPDVWYATAKIAGVEVDEQLIFEDTMRGLDSINNTDPHAIAVAIPVYNLPQTIMPLVERRPARIFMDWREINIGALINNLNRNAF